MPQWVFGYRTTLLGLGFGVRVLGDASTLLRRKVRQDRTSMVLRWTFGGRRWQIVGKRGEIGLRRVPAGRGRRGRRVVHVTVVQRLFLTMADLSIFFGDVPSRRSSPESSAEREDETRPTATVSCPRARRSNACENDAWALSIDVPFRSLWNRFRIRLRPARTARLSSSTCSCTSCRCARANARLTDEIAREFLEGLLFDGTLTSSEHADVLCMTIVRFFRPRVHR